MSHSPSLSLSGIIPPMVTPLTPSGRLDADGTARVIEHLIQGAASGIFILGTTGEGQSVSLSIREELTRITCRQVRGRVRVLVGVSSTCMDESLQLARLACDFGADAVVATPPFYILPSQAELCDYLAAMVSQLPLPLVLYNIPSLTCISWELGTVRRAMENRNIIGIKDSSGDMKYFQYLCELGKQRSDWSIFMGSEELLVPAIHAGAHGGVAGGANVFPRLYSALHQAADARNDLQTERLLPVAKQIQRLLFSFSQGVDDGIRRIKAAMSCLGLCGTATAPPLRRVSEEERKIMRPKMDAISEEIARTLSVPPPTALRGTHIGKVCVD
jgi:dihydrodipicolinate synthase/N-acetylneuraminate lyase